MWLSNREKTEGGSEQIIFLEKGNHNNESFRNEKFVESVSTMAKLCPQMQISEIGSKHFILSALNLRELACSVFIYPLFGLRSGKPGEGDIDGRATLTVKRGYSSFSFGLPFFTFKCEDKPLVVGV